MDIILIYRHMGNGVYMGRMEGYSRNSFFKEMNVNKGSMYWE